MAMIDMTEFEPDEAMNGYSPIEDHGLIGDNATAALVRLDGAIDWLCVPRFDSFPLFLSPAGWPAWGGIDRCTGMYG